MSAMMYKPGEMRAAQGEIFKANGKLGQIQSDIQNELKTVLATWTDGADMIAFSAYQKTWDGIFEDVGAILRDLGVIVGMNADNADGVEKTNAQYFNA